MAAAATAMHDETAQPDCFAAGLPRASRPTRAMRAAADAVHNIQPTKREQATHHRSIVENLDT